MLGTTEATRLLRPLRFVAFPSLWWGAQAGKPRMIGGGAVCRAGHYLQRVEATKPALLELTDSAPEDPNVESRVRAIAASETGVIGLDKCHARKMGLSYYVDLHIIVS